MTHTPTDDTATADADSRATETVSRRIDRTVIAVRSEDSEEASRSIAYLSLCPSEDVCEELGQRILAANQQRQGSPLRSSAYMPEPAEAYALVDALRAEDPARVLEIVHGDFPTLITMLVCTLAALEDSIL